MAGMDRALWFAKGPIRIGIAGIDMPCIKPTDTECPRIRAGDDTLCSEAGETVWIARVMDTVRFADLTDRLLREGVDGFFRPRAGDVEEVVEMLKGKKFEEVLRHQ